MSERPRIDERDHDGATNGKNRDYDPDRDIDQTHGSSWSTPDIPFARLDSSRRC
jgi:hypothetical protein